MHVRFLPAAILFLILATLPAGCTTTPASPPVTTTPVAYTELSQLAFTREELPFAVRSEKTQNPNMLDPTLHDYGALRGYTKYSINEQPDADGMGSSQSIQVGQTIVEYPPGNASKAFAAFVNASRSSSQQDYRIDWLPDPRIGEQSAALSIVGVAGGQKPTVMIVFVKSGIMESVIMISPTTDVPALTRLARIAAAKIP